MVRDILLVTLGQLLWLRPLSRSFPSPTFWWGGGNVGEAALMLWEHCSAAARTLVRHQHLYSYQCKAQHYEGAAAGENNSIPARPNTRVLLCFPIRYLVPDHLLCKLPVFLIDCRSKGWLRHSNKDMGDQEKMGGEKQSELTVCQWVCQSFCWRLKAACQCSTSLNYSALPANLSSNYISFNFKWTLIHFLQRFSLFTTEC